MSVANRRQRKFRFRRGALIEVRSLAEIQATLDAEGKLEGLPFMPEMARYCGRVSRIFRRVDKVFLDRYYYVARLKGTVLLEDLRCDGSAHDGCQMGCTLLWKEAWLKPAGAPELAAPTVQPATGTAGEQAGTGLAGLSILSSGTYCCQASQLIYATTRLPWWDVRQYVRDLVYGETTLWHLARSLPGLALRKLGRMFGSKSNGAVAVKRPATAEESLNFQPGEWVEVKGLAEIQATLDATGRNRGLSFGGEMTQFCGKRFRVARRVEKLILEWSGEMRRLRNTVALEGVTCQGLSFRCCPRNCYHLWREVWLKRTEG